jgi:hypothetical protein
MAIRRPWVVTVLVVPLLALAVLAISSLGAGPTSRTSAQSSSGEGTEQPSATPSARPSAAPGAPGAAGAGPADATSTAGEDLPDVTDELQPGVEMVESPGRQSPGLSTARASRRQRAANAELNGDFPELQVRRGGLVADHPSAVVPVPDRATITSSSVASEGAATQVAVVAEVAAPVSRALRYYRVHFSPLGFTEDTAQPTGQGTTTSFRRAPHSVVVTAHRAGSGTAVTVLALLRTNG